MNNLAVREATVADATGIVEVFNPIIESGLYTSIRTPFSVEEEEQYIRNLSERRCCTLLSSRMKNVSLGSKASSRSLRTPLRGLTSG